MFGCVCAHRFACVHVCACMHACMRACEYMHACSVLLCAFVCMFMHMFCTTVYVNVCVLTYVICLVCMSSNQPFILFSKVLIFLFINNESNVDANMYMPIFLLGKMKSTQATINKS